MPRATFRAALAAFRTANMAKRQWAETAARTGNARHWATAQICRALARERCAVAQATLSILRAYRREQCDRYAR